MKKAVNIFLVVFYSLGTLCLPMGDFSALKDIPEMYRHCKATEDKDMTPLDFITDHLVNIDGLFDKHDNGDDQKPHASDQNHHHAQPTVFFVTDFTFSVKPVVHFQDEPAILSENFLPSDYMSEVFRPPVD